MGSISSPTLNTQMGAFFPLLKFNLGEALDFPGDEGKQNLSTIMGSKGETLKPACYCKALLKDNASL